MGAWVWLSLLKALVNSIGHACQELCNLPGLTSRVSRSLHFLFVLAAPGFAEGGGCNCLPSSPSQTAVPFHLWLLGPELLLRQGDSTPALQPLQATLSRTSQVLGWVGAVTVMPFGVLNP